MANTQHRTSFSLAEVAWKHWWHTCPDQTNSHNNTHSLLKIDLTCRTTAWRAYFKTTETPKWYEGQHSKKSPSITFMSTGQGHGIKRQCNCEDVVTCPPDAYQQRQSKKQNSVMRHWLHKQLRIHHVIITFYGWCAWLENKPFGSRIPLGSNPTTHSYSWLGKVSFLPVSSSMLVWSCLQGQ